MIDIFVAGFPRPQGSKNGYIRGGNVVLVESAGQPLKDWRDTMVNTLYVATRASKADFPLTGPLLLEVTFYLPCPKNLPKRSTPPHTRTPDLDKLLRACGDSLTQSGAIVDDSLFTQIDARKQYARDEDNQPIPTGARIKVSKL